MTALVLADPRPILRLYASRRALLALAVCCFWGVGAAWVVVVASAGRAEDADLTRRLLAAGLVGLPATLGLLVGNAAQELRRRPVTSRLPRLGERLAAASLALGAGAALLAAALLVPPLGGARAVLGGVGVGAVGYVLGVSVMAPFGGGLGWFARALALLGAYAIAEPLVAWAGTSPAGGAALLVLAFAAHRLRFGRAAGRPTSSTGEHSLFLNRPVLVAAAEDAAALDADGMPAVAGRAGGPIAPSVPAGASELRRWLALRRFEQVTSVRGGELRIALVLLPVALVAALAGAGVGAAVDGELPGSAAELAARAHAALTVPGASGRELGIALVAFVVLASLAARRPLEAGPWRPLPRRLLPGLVLHLQVTRVTGALLLLGLVCSAALLALGPWSERPPAAGPPRFAVLLLGGWAAAPWLHALARVLAPTRLAGSFGADMGWLLAGAILLSFTLDSTVAAAAPGWGALVAASVGAAVVGHAVLFAVVSREVRTRDLVGE